MMRSSPGLIYACKLTNLLSEAGHKIGSFITMNPCRKSVVNENKIKKDTGGGMSRLVAGRKSMGKSA
ncbi:hypothetical protein DPMN_078658 [Dreissena polymorpha]|uniref:Uncharacterized protein n=1 Tax=Dreissena polymorpha TaxID=45954 RepID=A0A9D3YMM9_DREPO|nr:hypothetical protein DPMN_078658 [Dreissena polymorpha]